MLTKFNPECGTSCHHTNIDAEDGKSLQILVFNGHWFCCLRLWTIIESDGIMEKSILLAHFTSAHQHRSACMGNRQILWIWKQVFARVASFHFLYNIQLCDKMDHGYGLSCAVHSLASYRLLEYNKWSLKSVVNFHLSPK